MIKKAEVVLNSIQSIFQNILKFRLYLVSDTFIENEVTNQYEHRAFDNMIETYNEFKGHSVFLYKGFVYFLFFCVFNLKFILFFFLSSSKTCL